jgi:hypothetical protein
MMRANHLVVANAPHGHALVPLDLCLRELVELLVLAALDVHLDYVEPGARDRLLERLPEWGRDAPHLAKPGRVEPAAVAEHTADRLVFPRRHLLEHVQLGRDELQAERCPPQQAKRAPSSPARTCAVARATSFVPSLSQSSDDWCTVWKSSSSG